MGWSSKSLVQKSAFQQKNPSSGTGPHGILSPKLSGQSFFSAKVFVFLLRICEFMVININIYVYTYIFIFFVSIFFCGEGSGIDSEKIHFNHRNHGLSSYHAAKMTKQIVANWLFSRGSQAAGRLDKQEIRNVPRSMAEISTPSIPRHSTWDSRQHPFQVSRKCFGKNLSVPGYTPCHQCKWVYKTPIYK